MPKFEVGFKGERYTYVGIEAKNKAEAKRKALALDSQVIEDAWIDSPESEGWKLFEVVE